MRNICGQTTTSESTPDILQIKPFLDFLGLNMPPAFDKCKERPQQIEQILNGLDRYNPETTTTFQEYVAQQCEEKFFDVYSSLALLKL